MSDETIKLTIRTALIPNYYQNFHCLASECRDSCCIDWRITFNKKDYLRLRRLEAPPELKARLEAEKRITTELHMENSTWTPTRAAARFWIRTACVLSSVPADMRRCPMSAPVIRGSSIIPPLPRSTPCLPPAKGSSNSFGTCRVESNLWRSHYRKQSGER